MVLAAKKIALGVDIGGTRIKTVALETPDKVLEEHRIDSDAKFGPDAVRTAVKRSIDYYKQKGITFHSVGLGCAGSVDPKTGVVLNSPNFAQWKNVPLKQWIAEDYGINASVDNDANCAMFTEWKLGHAMGAENAVLLTFGTGVGGGLIINKRLFTGSTGSAAELGHFSIHADGIECSCGNKGCFERYCSASALERMLPGYPSKEIFYRAAANEEPYRQVLDKFLHELRIGVTSIANIFDPDVILIGGGLSNGIAPYLGNLQDWVGKHAFPAVSKHVKVMQTKFANLSGAIGAALLSLEVPAR